MNRLSKVDRWILAARPKTLWAATAPVIMGTAMAFGGGRGAWLPAMMALLGALAIQVGTNLANDYYDWKKGADGEERLGPTRMTQAGLISPSAMRWGIAVAFLLASVAGLYLVYRGGWVIALIGVLSILSGIFYTAGPYPLGYIGLADLFVLIFFGPVAVGGTYYVQALSIEPAVVAAGLAPGLFSVAILAVNNLRDVETDARSGKKTLAVRFGKRFARMEYVVSILLACFIPVALFLHDGNHPWSLMVLIVPVVGMTSLKTVWTCPGGAVLNEVLAATGRLLLVFSVLFSIGWVF